MQSEILADVEENHLVDISTLGRNSGGVHRHEIWLHVVDQAFYLTGKPAPRDWLANLRANPQMTLHLKHALQRDLPAFATEISDDEARRNLLTAILQETPYWDNREAWIRSSPLVRVELLADLSLELVTDAHQHEYVAMMQEALATEEGYPYTNYPLALSDFAAFVKELADEAQGIGIPEDIPPQETYVLRFGPMVVGEFRFRPKMEVPYEKYNGHIAYNIRNSQRRKGYATQGLRLMLAIARDRGLPGVCLTVNSSNEGSKRVVERNGGKVTHQLTSLDDGDTTLCYWIDTKQAV